MRREKDSKRVKVWMAMAEQFLDTEMRTEIPNTALICVEHGLSVREAHRVWRYEVAPAVWFNAWDVAGEWAGWPEEWLVDQICGLRGRWPNRPGAVPYLVYRARVHFVHRSATAIGRCMEYLLGQPPPRRAPMTDLTLLAKKYFHFACDGMAPPSGSKRDELAQLFSKTFRPIFEPLVAAPLENQEACTMRVERWLGH